ncbi:hypothetical protein BDQ17DRAFT_1241508 [Cyathus striatus]|nr:hypothetical protein BDQ17DRAFT_1241508 [Cyathus striatus]
MANDPSLPSLALSDIMYNMSPSPGTRQSPEEPSTVQEREVSPEPVSAEDIERMRQKVQETVLKFGFNGQFSSMERELMEMVLRLTSSSFIDPSQLIRQGEIISGLTSQRDYLVRQAEEARQRFESEKDGWTRMAEALIAQRHKHGNSGMREQELERQCSTMQSDNRNLRAKVCHTFASQALF